MTILPIDEINALEERIKPYFENGRIRSRKDAEAIIDELLDLFLLAYATGAESVNQSMGTQIESTSEDVEKVVYERIDGKTWEDRVWDYYENGGDVYDIARIAATEAHRDANEAAFNTANEAGATTKQWHCMMLPTSRDDHIYLDGTTTSIDGYFYAPGGERTLYPGQWGVPEQDCNCLCWLTYS